MAFILTPLAFSVIGYLVIYLVFGSIIDPLAGAWNLITGGDKVHGDEDLTVNRLDGYTETVPSSLIKFPNFGDIYGRLSIPSADILDAPVYYGDDEKLLKKGICQYNGSLYVGSGSTVLLSGHNNTYLHTLGNAQVGDTVTFSTQYGDYVYEIESTAIMNHKDSAAYDLSADYENLVIYTCYPFNTLGLTAKRYFVYCKYVSGPRILYDR